MALIEIDGLPWVDLSMANCECHNQMVSIPNMIQNGHELEHPPGSSSFSQ